MFFDQENGPADFAGNPIFNVVFATLASQTVLRSWKYSKKLAQTPAVRLQQNHQERGKNAITNRECALRNSGRHRTERC